jgi:hypothetical protein
LKFEQEFQGLDLSSTSCCFDWIAEAQGSLLRQDAFCNSRTPDSNLTDRSCSSEYVLPGLILGTQVYEFLHASDCTILEGAAQRQQMIEGARVRGCHCSPEIFENIVWFGRGHSDLHVFGHFAEKSNISGSAPRGDRTWLYRTVARFTFQNA